MAKVAVARMRLGTVNGEWAEMTGADILSKTHIASHFKHTNISHLALIISNICFIRLTLLHSLHASSLTPNSPTCVLFCFVLVLYRNVLLASRCINITLSVSPVVVPRHSDSQGSSVSL